MRSRFLTAILATGCLSWPAPAVEPETWILTSTEDFMAGESSGVAVSATGELLPGPAIEKLAALDEPFVLAQVTAADGSILLGTGNEGKVYRLRGDDLEVVFDAAEEQIYALEVRGNDLFVGSSPQGKVYRVDLRSGNSEIWAEPGEAYIWAIEALPGGNLAVATGLDGKLYRVTGKGSATVLFDAPEMHLRSIASAGGDTLLVGGSGEGRIYEIRGDGSARALYDSSLTEISALHYDAERRVAWAAAGKSVLPTAVPQQQQQQQSSGSGQGSQGQSGQGSGDASVSVSFSFDEASQLGGPVQPVGSSELYRIDADGYVDTVWRLDREIIYSIDRDAGGEGIIVSTGANGRIYRVRGDQVSLIAKLPEKQVVAYRAAGNRALATTTNAGGVYELDFSRSGQATYESVVKDTRRLSRFGHYRIEGREIPGGVVVSWRSGNTSAPDQTWSEWRQTRGASGTIDAPPARFLQWKLELPGGSPATRVDEVRAVFVNHNAPPKIEQFSMAEPAVVYLTGGYPTSPGVVEATNPDQYGIFTSIDAPAQQEAGKKYFRKGFRTVGWKASDPNGDTLEYDLFFRRRGMSEWLRLRENLSAEQMNFDTSQLPDGEYELRLVVTDAPSNPVDPRQVERSDLSFKVDNTGPSIRAERSSAGRRIVITDAASPVTKVEYAVDAEKWRPLLPVDGISDSQTETYELEASSINGRFVIVRAVDAFYNVTTTAIE